MSELRIDKSAYEQMIAHCLDTYPLEGCGLLAGVVDAHGDTTHASQSFPTRNDAASARVYTVNPLDHLKADQEAEDNGQEIVGVFHSHTHTPAYPSPTDVAQAPDPNWHYVLVSFEGETPVVRSYRIIDGNISEESLVLST